MNCNEPFGGFCNETGVCTCTNGYHGEHCSISPELDQFGFLDFLCDTQSQVHPKSKSYRQEQAESEAFGLDMLRPLQFMSCRSLGAAWLRLL